MLHSTSHLPFGTKSYYSATYVHLFKLIGWMTSIGIGSTYTWVVSPWIGLTDRQNEGTWVWESGKLLTYRLAPHWKRGQPDNWGDEDCVYINIDIMGMVDISCKERKFFICQKRSGARPVCFYQFFLQRDHYPKMSVYGDTSGFTLDVLPPCLGSRTLH